MDRCLLLCLGSVETKPRLLSLPTVTSVNNSYVGNCVGLDPNKVPDNFNILIIQIEQIQMIFNPYNNAGQDP